MSSVASQSTAVAPERPCRVCGKRYRRHGLASHVRACERRAKMRAWKEKSGTVALKADHQYRPWIISAADYTCVGRGLGTPAAGEYRRVSLLGFARTQTPYAVELTAWEWLHDRTETLDRVIGMYPVVVRHGRIYTEPDAITAVTDHRPPIQMQATVKKDDRASLLQELDVWEVEGKRLIWLSAGDAGSAEEQLAFLLAMRKRICHESTIGIDIASATVNVTTPPNSTVRPSVPKLGGGVR